MTMEKIKQVSNMNWAVSEIETELLNSEPKKILQNAICVIAEELDIDPERTREETKGYDKEHLIELFTKIKDLRVMRENMRIVDLLLKEE